MTMADTNPTGSRAARRHGLATLLAAPLAAALILSAGPLRADEDMEKLLKAGAKSFNKCKICHSLEAGQNKLGPHLHDLFGRKAGSVEGYSYSDAMKESGLVWEDDTLTAYLENPKKVVPKGKMAFAGIRKESEMAALLAYLHKATQ